MPSHDPLLSDRTKDEDGDADVEEAMVGEGSLCQDLLLFMVVATQRRRI